MLSTVSIDLVICTYNNAALLDRVLQAIARQEVPPQVHWSVLVVDNNCTDGTSAVVETQVQLGKIPGLRRIVEPKQGLTYARLCGIQQTQADWIAFVDDDCLLEPDWVDQAAQFVRTHPDIGAFGGQVMLDWETPPPAFVLNYGYSFAQQEHGLEPKCLSCLVGAGLVVRRAALSVIGWLECQFMTDRVGKKLISGGDVELALRIAAQYTLWYNPTCKLRHIIPAWRTTPQYLNKINYGLGTSQHYGNSMLWAGSYPTWLVVSLKDALKSLGAILVTALKVAVRRRHPADLAIAWNFWQGKWMGVWSMAWMDSHKRQALLGCAAVKQR